MDEPETVGSRLKRVRESLNKSQRDLARELGFGPNAWQLWESNKNVPSGENLIRIAELGFNPGWILTGKGQMRFDDAGDNVTGDRRQADTFDPELLARINDIISKVYKEENARISPADMGRVAASKYAAILSASSDPDERLIMVKLFEAELRQEIRAMGNNHGKASA